MVLPLNQDSKNNPANQENIVSRAQAGPGFLGSQETFQETPLTEGERMRAQAASLAVSPTDPGVTDDDRSLQMKNTIASNSAALVAEAESQIVGPSVAPRSSGRTITSEENAGIAVRLKRLREESEAELSQKKKDPVKKVKTKIAEERFTNASLLDGFRRLQSVTDAVGGPEALLSAPGRLAFLAAKAEDAFNSAEPEDKAFIEAWTDIAQFSAKVLNKEIKEKAGSNVTGNELKRITAEFPNVGGALEFFDGDSPTEFMRKLNNSIMDLNRVTARGRILEARDGQITPAGMEDMPLSEIDDFVNEAVNSSEGGIEQAAEELGLVWDGGPIPEGVTPADYLLAGGNLNPRFAVDGGALADEPAAAAVEAAPAAPAAPARRVVTQNGQRFDKDTGEHLGPVQ
jgi:hypothetical protein